MVVETAERGRQWGEMGGPLKSNAIFTPAQTTTSPFNSSSTSASTSSTVSPTPRLQSLPPATLDKMMKPPTLRTRSTGGLLLTTSSGKGHEFDEVEEPSPILTSTHQGLTALSESLAQLMTQRRHSFVGDENVQRPLEHEARQQGTVGSSAVYDKSALEEDSKFHSLQSKDTSAHTHNITTKNFRPTSSRPASPNMQSELAIPTKSQKAPHFPLSPPVADIALKAPSKASSNLIPAAAMVTGNQTHSLLGPSAVGMLRKASADNHASATSSHTGSPPESGSSTPRMFGTGKGKPQVLETNHLQLQTHGPSGRRMINQYIIETELGRGVHGKVRLARDTETGEKVAVKIVEREGKKRLGGGLGWNSKSRQEESPARKDEASEKRSNRVVSNDTVDPSSSSDPITDGSGQHARFAGTPTSPPRSPSLVPNRSGVPPSPNSLAAAARYGRWGTGAPSRPTYGDKEAERLREKEKEKFRKRLLWTTDKKVKREIALLKKCAHENVVQLKEVIDDPSSKKIFMVLEFMEGGEVQWKDQRGFPTLTVDEARRTLRDVVLGLEYLHYQGIIHRDIKPANLLWDANRKVKISDFGVSHFSYALLVASGGLPSQDSDEERMKDPSLVDDHELAKTAGSPAFFAPELCLTGESMQTANSSQLSPLLRSGKTEDSLEFPWKQANRSSPFQTPEAAPAIVPAKSTGSLGRKSRPPITKAIDVWALGVTLYCLLFGHVPFTAESEFALFTVIPREDYELPAFMGADRIRIGPRRRRWTSLPQWRDEEADVDRESDGEAESDIDSAELSEEARLVRDLLDGLLEKDPAKRIKLEEVKKHPWVVRDIADPPLWLSETDPAQLPFVQVSNEEVEDALTGFSKIKQTLKRFQSKLFAGFGVQSHHGVERPEQQHRRMHLSGGALRRQRSKSASHAHGIPSLILTSTEKRESPAEDSATIGVSAPVTTANTPKGSLANRPHFFSRRQSTALLTPEKTVTGPTMTLLRGEKEKSQSQPNSRPHSPAAGTERVSRGEMQDSNTAAAAQDEGTLESGQQASHRRPTSFFKRAASRGDAREGLSAQRMNPSSDGLNSIHVHPQKNHSTPSSSRPTSKASTMRLNSNSGATKMAKSDSSPARRSSQESETGQWSLVSASQSGASTLQRSTSSRTRSRSRLGDVFRNVLGHHQGTERQHNLLRSRPGTASSHVAPSLDRTSNRSSSMNPTLMAPLSASHFDKDSGGEQGETSGAMPDRQEKEGGSREGEEQQQQKTLQPTLRAVEVDDYDVDLDLSDDDLDEGKGNEEHRIHSILRNEGNGWVMERGDSSSSSGARYPPESINLDSLTPSVEGGYNLFKPPYTGIVAGEGRVEGDRYDMESFAMTQVHSDEAEALRRASAKVDDARLNHHEPLGAYNGADKTDSHAMAPGDVTATSDDRFADADEEEDDHDGQNNNEDDEDEGEDEDDGGVSFQARKRAPS